MTARDLEWIEGAPEKLEPGMALRFEMGQVTLIEHSDQFLRDGRFSSVRVERVRSQVVAWAWVSTPTDRQPIDDLSMHGWPEDDSPRQQRIEQGGELVEVYEVIDRLGEGKR